MKHRYFPLLILVSILTIVIPIPALAGGWASITVDELPAGVAAGEKIGIGFQVLQHGKSPMTGLQPTLTFSQAGGKERFVVEASADGKVGHYTAWFTFPSAGTWSWSIQAFSMDQPMPPIVVGGASAGQPAQSRPAPILWVLAGGGGLAFLAASGWAFFRRRTRLALALGILGLAIASAGFFFNNPRLIAQPASAAPAESAQPASLETGPALFVSKGCVSCHANRRIDQAYYVFSTEMGPDLTELLFTREYLRTWLKNPAAVKPKTLMPNLELDEAEIEALTAFLSSE